MDVILYLFDHQSKAQAAKNEKTKNALYDLETNASVSKHASQTPGKLTEQVMKHFEKTYLTRSNDNLISKSKAKMEENYKLYYESWVASLHSHKIDFHSSSDNVMYDSKKKTFKNLDQLEPIFEDESKTKARFHIFPAQYITSSSALPMFLLYNSDKDCVYHFHLYSITSKDHTMISKFESFFEDKSRTDLHLTRDYTSVERDDDFVVHDEENSVSEEKDAAWVKVATLMAFVTLVSIMPEIVTCVHKKEGHEHIFTNISFMNTSINKEEFEAFVVHIVQEFKQDKKAKKKKNNNKMKSKT